MNDVREVISLLREEVDKHLDVEKTAASFLTNIFLDTYAHNGEGDEEDPTPSIIHDIPVDTVQRVLLIVAGCALAFQQASEEAYDEQVEEEKEEGGMSALDIAKWESYLDGVITLTSGLMGLGLALADTATASGELTVEDIIRGGSPEDERPA
jgi:hypothetical protein